MRRHRRRGRATALGALVAAVAVLLAGCAIPLPTVDAEPAPEGLRPALDEPRLDRVLAAVTDALAAGDAAASADELGDRVDGPALLTRQAEYRLQAATADTESPLVPRTLVTEPQQVVMDHDEGWPKRVFVVTTIPDGSNTPLLLGLEQDDPRAPYQLFSWVRLLPDLTTPATAVPVEGSPEVAPDAEGLVLSPQQALAAYADVLQRDTESEYAATFAEDAFRQAVVADRAGIEEGIAEAGDYSETFGVPDFTPVSMRTADGGAIVLGALRADQVYELTEDGGELTISTPQLVALAGAEDAIDVETSLTASYQIMVALYVPPAADGATIQVLGAERVLDAVETE